MGLNRPFAVAALVTVACACETETQPEQKKESTVATAPRASTPKRIPARPTPARGDYPRRPRAKAELALTEERRQRIESEVPEARGFLDLRPLEEALYELDIKRGDAERAVRAFDERAAGNWLLLTGNLANPRPDGFDIAIRYRRSDGKKPGELTNTWFFVHVSDITGYDPKQYNAGDLVAVLARYEGKQLAKPGHDLVQLRKWPALAAASSE
jgi:hypothetical protein